MSSSELPKAPSPNVPAQGAQSAESLAIEPIKAIPENKKLPVELNTLVLTEVNDIISTHNAQAHFQLNCKRHGYSVAKGVNVERELLECVGNLLLSDNHLLKSDKRGITPRPYPSSSPATKPAKPEIEKWVLSHLRSTGKVTCKEFFSEIAERFQIRITLLTSHPVDGLYTIDPSDPRCLIGGIMLGTVDGKHFFPVELPLVSDSRAIPALGNITFIGLLGLFNLTALVLNKLSLSSYAHMAPTPSSMIELFLILIAPAVLTFPFALAVHLVREGKENKLEKRQRHFRKPALFLVVLFEAALEGCGLVTFALFVLPKYGAITALVSLQALRWAPALVLLILRLDVTKRIGFQSMHNLRPLTMIILSILIFTGSFMLFLALKDWLALACVLAFSLSHWRSWSASLEEEQALGITPKSPVARFLQAVHSGQRFYRYWMATFHSLLLICIISGYFFAVFFLRHEFTGADLRNAFRSFPESPTAGACYTQLVTGAASYLGCWVALSAGSGRTKLMDVAFVAPLWLATPISFIIITVMCAGNHHRVGVIASFASTCGKELDIALPALGFSGIALSIGALCTLLPKAALLERLGVKAERELWGRPGYASIVAEHALDLNCSLVEHTTPSAHRHDFVAYIIGCLWRETEAEMNGFIKSVISLSMQSYQRREDFTVFLMFDEAFDKDGVENEHVAKLKNVLRKHKLDWKYAPKKPWYGDCFHVVLPGPGIVSLYVHLKDTSKVRQLKRWSHVLALDLIFERVRCDPEHLRRAETSYFVLLVDGDTKFSKAAFDGLRAHIDEEPARIGAVSGRIMPHVREGPGNPLVWFQMFSYAAGHWFQKAAEHMLGSVLCAPGCFSLVRLSAFYRQAGDSQRGWMDGSKPEKPALQEYAKNPRRAMAYLSFNQGEDRMLSTLLIKNGWLLQYNSTSIPVTACPDNFSTYCKQQRRWVVSTNVNMLELITDTKELVKKNKGISFPYMIYIFVVVLCSLLTPAVTIVVTLGGLRFGLHAPTWLTYCIGLGIPLFYILICFIYHVTPVKMSPLTGDSEEEPASTQEQKRQVQIYVAEILCYIYMVLMGLSLLSLVIQFSFADTLLKEPAAIYLFAMAGMFIIAALLHGDFLMLIHGVLYFFWLPFNYVVLQIFVYANLHDLSWGTRDDPSGTDKKKKPLVICSCSSFWRWILSLLRRCSIDSGLRESEDIESGERKPEGDAKTQGNSTKTTPERVAADSEGAFDWLQSMVTANEQPPSRVQYHLGKKDDDLKEGDRRKTGDDQGDDQKEDDLRSRLQRLSDYLGEIQEKIRVEMIRPTDRDKEKKEEISLRLELAGLQQSVGWSLLVFSLVVIVLSTFDAFAPSTSSGKDRVLRIGYLVVAASASPVVLQFLCMLLYRFGALISNIRQAARTSSAITSGPFWVHGDDVAMVSTVPSSVFDVKGVERTDGIGRRYTLLKSSAPTKATTTL